MIGTFAQEFRDLMFNGVGNEGNQWTRKAVAQMTRISEPTLRKIAEGNSFPTLDQRRRLDSVLFPNSNQLNDATFRKYVEVWEDERQYRLAERNKAASWTNKNAYSLRDLWGKLIASKGDEFSILVSGSNPRTKFGGFAPGDIEISNTGLRFFLDYPENLREAVECQGLQYDLHSSGAEFLGQDLATYSQHLPKGFLEEKIHYYSHQYASRLLDAFKRSRGAKPYNV